MDDKWNKEEEWKEESSEPLDMKLVAIIVLGLAVLAVIICTGLWYFTHADKTEEEGEGFVVQATEHPSTPSEPNLDPASESTFEPITESTPEPTTESIPEPTTESTPGSITEPTPDSVIEPTSKPTTEPIPEVTSSAAPAQTSAPATESTAQAAASGSVQGAGGQETASGNVSMEFAVVKESVMPKDVLNLRSAPTTTDEGNIVTQIQNGEVIVRTGINENTGWSEVEYQGQVLYAVSQYLTTDLGYQVPVKPSDPNRVSTIGGRIILFTNCDDWISPKEYVNLRTEPSTAEGDNTVSCQLNYGEKVHRTGYSADAGWSRVEHNGQVLYVVTSFMLEASAE